MKKLILSILFIISLNSASLAQDVIYTVNGNRIENAKLSGLTEDKVSFTVQKTDKPSSFSFQRQNVLIAFSQTGNFLVIKDLSSDLNQAQQQLQAYLTAPARSKERDFLVKAVPLTVIPAVIGYESETVVNYQNREGKSASILKTELIAIVYRDGRHTLLREPAEVSPLLTDVQKQINRDQSTTITSPQPNQTPPPVSVVATPQTAAPLPFNEKKQDVIQQQEGVIPTPTGKPILDEADYQLYRKKALQKVDEFVSYLNIITNKNLSINEKDEAIAQAVKLFMPAAMMEVTSKSRVGSRRYPIREYLTRLKLLPYNSTKIEWSEVQYIKELSQAADGNYYGIITGQQTFIGYGNQNETIYTDIVQKNVRVKLQSYEKIVDGASSTSWGVLLGSIGVAAQ